MKRIFTISVIAVLLVSLVPIPYTVSAEDPPLLSKVWVDDDWNGYSNGTDVDGPIIGIDAFGTIQDGIDAATPEGTVNVAAGTYNENIIVSAKKKVKILGAGADVTTIIGDGSTSVVTGNSMHADSRIEGFTITSQVQNHTPIFGGGINLENSATTIANCNITGNSAAYGGGIHISWISGTVLSPQVINSLVINNSATVWGGGIFFVNYSLSQIMKLSPTVMNSTIADNTGGDGVYNLQADTTIINTIIYGNSLNNLTDAGGGTSTTSFSLIYTDPLSPSPFVGSGDYHLQSGSLCIDAGDPSFTGPPLTDLDGNSRIVNSVVDMGAYEYQISIINVKIDIKPGSDPNSINLGSKGVVPVAVLTTDGFNASEVDAESVKFAGTEPERWTSEDVDEDGDLDLLFHFKTQELDLTTDSTEATLTGKTLGEIDIEGTDTVRIVPPKGKK